MLWSVLCLLGACRAPDGTSVSLELLQRAGATEVTRESESKAPDVALARRDPLAFLRSCIDHYDRSISDYRCTFLVRERLNGSLGPEQEMDIRFREHPFSVDVRWRRGTIGAERVNYVAGRWTRGAREFALVQPSGALGWLAPGGVRRHIHAPDVLAASRRPIDRFGFRHTLDAFVKECERARGDPEFTLLFVGIGRFDGYRCFVFDRRLPEGRERTSCTDRAQRMYVDAEWLVPRACFSYADDARSRMLGSYVARDIEMNIGLSDDDFAVP